MLTLSSRCSRASGSSSAPAPAGSARRRPPRRVALGLAERGREGRRGDDRPGAAAGQRARARGARQRAAADRPRALREHGVETGELWAMMLDAKRTFDELIEHLAPDARTRDEVLANRIYQQLSTAVAGSQEFTAIAKLYELDQEGDCDVLVLDTPPSRNALDFLDAPGAAHPLLPGPRDPDVPAPGRARRAHPRARHRRRVRRAAAGHRRRPAARPVGRSSARSAA